MSGYQIPHIVHVDVELDRLVNDVGMDQVAACRLLYGADPVAATTMITTQPKPIRPVEPAPVVPVAPLTVRGRRPVADVLRWLTGGGR